MQKEISYSEIVLKPNYFTGNSRRSISTKTKKLANVWNSPLIPANMSTTISFEKCDELYKNNYFPICHRFYKQDDIIQYCKNSNFTSISIGIKEEDNSLLKKLKYNNCSPNVITIDIAHGDCIGMKDAIKRIRELFPHTDIIAGNVMTPESCIRLKIWGADVIKIGLSMGKACTTFNVTGVGSPMFSTVKNCSEWLNKVFGESAPTIIADGGIREPGDIVKAINAGADFVMAGSIFVKCKDSPTEHLNGKSLYFGSASARNKGKNEYVEGLNEEWLPENGLTYLELYDSINESLQSAISYSGGKTLYDIRKMEARLK